MDEIIIAVAFKWHGLIISMPKPARHHNVIAEMFQFGLPKEMGFVQNQGFITNMGRFVDRVEGFKIAKEADQIKGNVPNLTEYLISEDLW